MVFVFDFLQRFKAEAAGAEPVGVVAVGKLRGPCEYERGVRRAFHAFPYVAEDIAAF